MMHVMVRLKARMAALVNRAGHAACRRPCIPSRKCCLQPPAQGCIIGPMNGAEETPPLPAAEVWLQNETADGSFQCHAFAGVPVAQPCWIVLLSSGSPEGRNRVRDLHAELEAVLKGSSPEVTVTPMPVPAQPEHMRPDDPRFLERRKVLILLGGQERVISHQPWQAQWASDEHDADIMPVLPADGTPYASFFDSLINREEKHPVHKANACWWEKRISESLPALLSLARVSAPVARIFISYRRLETKHVAEQLADELFHAGFLVFFDRYSIPPGVDFQHKLTEDLQDKSMVLYLESRTVKQSKWTQHEIDFAKRHRLGFFTLRMPQVKPEERIASVRPDDCLELDAASDFDGSGCQATSADGKPATDSHGIPLVEWPRLTAASLAKVIADVKRVHAEALFRRRHRLRKGLVTILRRAGVRTAYAAAGPLVAEYNGHRHLIWPTTRPPDVADFHSTHAAHHARTPPTPGSRGIVIAPQSAQGHRSRTLTGWLAKVSGCPVFDEGNLRKFVRSLKGANW